MLDTGGARPYNKGTMKSWRKVLRIAGFSSIAAASVCSAQFITGWDLRLANPIPKSAVICWAGASDSQGNSYFVSVSTTTSYDYWTVFKIGPYGNEAWQHTFVQPLNSSPSSLLVDSAFNVYAVGGVRNTSNVQHLEIIKLSSAGSPIYQKAVASSAGGVFLMADTTDSQNNLFLATTVIENFVNPKLTVTKYSPAGAMLSSFTDVHIDPFAGTTFFDSEQDVACAGSSNDVRGAEVDLLTSTGNVLFDKQFPSFMQSGQMVTPSVACYPTPTLRDLLIAEHIGYTSGATTVSQYTLEELGSTGDIIWQDKPIDGSSMSVWTDVLADPTYWWVDYDTTSTGGTQQNVETVGPTGAEESIFQWEGVTTPLDPNHFCQLFQQNSPQGYVFIAHNKDGEQVFMRTGMANGDADWYGGPCIRTVDGKTVWIVAGTAPAQGQSGMTVERNVSAAAGQMTAVTATASAPSGGSVGVDVKLSSAAPAAGTTVNLSTTLGTFPNGKSTETVVIHQGSTSLQTLVYLPPTAKGQAVTIEGQSGGIKRDANSVDTAAKIASATCSSTVVCGNPVGVTLKFNGKMPKGSVIKVTSSSQSTIPNQTITLDEDAEEYVTTIDSKTTGSAGTVDLTFTDPNGQTAKGAVTMTK